MKVLKSMEFDQIVKHVEPIRVINPLNGSVYGAAPLDGASEKDLSFCTARGVKAVEVMLKSQAGVIICHDDLPGLEDIGSSKCILTTDRPRLAFLRCFNNLVLHGHEGGIHETALIDPGSVIDSTATIGPFAFVGDQVEIGKGAFIEHRSHIAVGSKIGNNVHIQCGAVVGCEGQGYERNERGVFEKFPQVGTVIIEDDVVIGANSTIVKGTFQATCIGKGSKIGHLTDIGHNVKIGNDVFISAGVVVGGSCVVGDQSWLAPKCCIRNKVTLGSGVTVGLGAVVTADVPDRLTVVGVPAKPLQKEK